MTREQQQATKALRKAEENYLRAYGWHQQGRDWVHPKISLLSFPQHDALMETRAKPQLGWP